MGADRIGVVEGLLHDVVHGRIPNVFAERGWRADWQHNRASLLGRITVRVVLISAAVAYLGGRRD